MPAPQPVDFVPADFYIQVPHRDEVRQRGHLILRGEDDARGPNRVWEAEFFDFRKALAQLKLSVAIDARVGDCLIERYFRRPLRDGIVALTAFIQADMHGLDFVQQFRGALRKQIGQPRCCSGVDQRHAVFFFEFFLVAELLRFEGMSRQVRAEINVMRAQPQRGPQDNLVKDRCRSVYDELAALRGLHNPT